MERIVESYTDDIEINVLDFDANSFIKSVNPIREFIVNAWDADSEKVMITTTSSSLIIEDWGTGIDNFKKFWTIGSHHRDRLSRGHEEHRPGPPVPPAGSPGQRPRVRRIRLSEHVRPGSAGRSVRAVYAGKGAGRHRCRVRHVRQEGRATRSISLSRCNGDGADQQRGDQSCRVPLSWAHGDAGRLDRQHGRGDDDHRRAAEDHVRDDARGPARASVDLDAREDRKGDPLGTGGAQRVLRRPEAQDRSGSAQSACRGGGAIWP